MTNQFSDALLAIRERLEAVLASRLNMGSLKTKTPPVNEFDGFVHVSVPLTVVVDRLGKNYDATCNC